MPWPRPRRTLCVLYLASCETVVSSFGVGTGTGVMPVQGTLMRGGTTSRDLRMTGLEDGSGRRGLPPVQATVAEAGTAPTTVAPPVSGGEGKGTIAEGDEPDSVAPPPPKAPKLPSIQNGWTHSPVMTLLPTLADETAPPLMESHVSPNQAIPIPPQSSESEKSPRCCRFGKRSRP